MLRKLPVRLPALAVIVGCAVALAQPEPQTVSGVFQAVVVEELGKGKPASTESLQYSLVTGAETLRLIFEDLQDAEKITPGSRVEVAGYRTGKQFTVLADSAAKARPNPHIRTMSAAAAPKTVGERKVAVLLVNFQNDQRQLIDSATATSAVFGDANSYYQENSYGNLSIVGDVYGYLTLSVTSTCNQVGLTDTTGGAGFIAIQDAAIAASQKAGINLNAYDTIFLIGPELDSCQAGAEVAATIGGTPGFVEYITKPTPHLVDHNVAHEIGHNLGLHHARFLNCGNAVYENNALSLCSYVEYGDFDVMGQSVNSSFHFNAVFKDYLGWLQPQLITATGNYQLTPYELGLGTKALKIAPLQASDTFYFEYRQRLGYDTNLDAYVNGPFLHLAGNPSYLLDINHETNGVGPDAVPLYPGLSPGQTYVDYANRFSVTNVGMTTESVQLRILMPGVDSPTLAFESPTDGVNVGGTVNISVDALDQTAISKIDLSLDGTLLTSLTVSPYTFAWNAAAASVGQHVLEATAYNTQGNTASQQITVTVSPQQIGALVDGASFLPAAAPGSIVSLFISGFSLPTAAASTIPLPTNLGGVTVTIAGQPLPLFYVSSTQINAQIPWNLPGGANSVTVSGGGVSATAAFSPVAAAPGIFVFGTDRAVAQNQDYTLNDASHPAKAGTYVTVYLTGIGPLDNPVGLGNATPSQPLSRATTLAQATVNGWPAQIQFLGMAPGFVGLAQANIQIPPGLPPGTYPIQIQMPETSVLSNAPLITTN
jgi:uncharacterized protein (TIGR03437 family)